MLARLQRTLVLTVIVASAAWWFWARHAGIGPGGQLLGLLLITLPHASVLAVEFVLLAALGNPKPAPRPSTLTLIGAWAGEVLNGAKVFGWRQPFRSQAEPDHLTADAVGRRGVVLVHGYVCNRGLWNGWMRRLRSRGVPFVAINLEPVFGVIDDYLPLLDAAVRRVEQASGLAPVIVAHSMGGLAVRAWLARHAADARVAHVITIGTPHHGTWLARFGFSPNARQMRRDSRWLAALAATEPPSRASRFTCYYGHCDNIVFPAATATLPGADNRHLAGWAHVEMVSCPEVFSELLVRLA